MTEKVSASKSDQLNKLIISIRVIYFHYIVPMLLQNHETRYIKCSIHSIYIIITLKYFQNHDSIDWFKGKITGKSHISWENLWFPVDFPINQPIDSIPSTTRNHSLSHGPISTERYLGSPILESVENNEIATGKNQSIDSLNQDHTRRPPHFLTPRC